MESFADTYTLTGFLGEGGFGKVYSSRHLVNYTLHAVKVLPDIKLRHKTFCLKRNTYIPDEVALWEPLDHPGIIKLQDVFFNHRFQNWNLVMEYIPGYIDLFEYINQRGFLSSSEVSNIIKQLLDICSYLALSGVDHKDIKDENILYNPFTKQIKLIDFGVAAELSSDQKVLSI